MERAAVPRAEACLALALPMGQATTYLHSARHQFTYYKTLGERTFAQVDDAQLFWRADPS